MKGNIPTYNGRDRRSGASTFGRYSNNIVVGEKFVLCLPPMLDVAMADAA